MFQKFSRSSKQHNKHARSSLLVHSPYARANEGLGYFCKTWPVGPVLVGLFVWCCRLGHWALGMSTIESFQSAQLPSRCLCFWLYIVELWPFLNVVMFRAVLHAFCHLLALVVPKMPPKLSPSFSHPFPHLSLSFPPISLHFSPVLGASEPRRTCTVSPTTLCCRAGLRNLASHPLFFPLLLLSCFCRPHPLLLVVIHSSSPPPSSPFPSHPLFLPLPSLFPAKVCSPLHFFHLLYMVMIVCI